MTHRALAVSFTAQCYSDARLTLSVAHQGQPRVLRAGEQRRRDGGLPAASLLPEAEECLEGGGTGPQGVFLLFVQSACFFEA